VTCSRPHSWQELRSGFELLQLEARGLDPHYLIQLLIQLKHHGWVSLPISFVSGLATHSYPFGSSLSPIEILEGPLTMVSSYCQKIPFPLEALAYLI
jgi:hypothetical protein